MATILYLFFTIVFVPLFRMYLMNVLHESKFVIQIYNKDILKSWIYTIKHYYQCSSKLGETRIYTRPFFSPSPYDERPWLDCNISTNNFISYCITITSSRPDSRLVAALVREIKGANIFFCNVCYSDESSLFIFSLLI